MDEKVDKDALIRELRAAGIDAVPAPAPHGTNTILVGDVEVQLCTDYDNSGAVFIYTSDGVAHEMPLGEFYPGDPELTRQSARESLAAVVTFLQTAK